MKWRNVNEEKRIELADQSVVGFSVVSYGCGAEEGRKEEREIGRAWERRRATTKWVEIAVNEPDSKRKLQRAFSWQTISPGCGWYFDRWMRDIRFLQPRLLVVGGRCIITLLSCEIKEEKKRKERKRGRGGVSWIYIIKIFGCCGSFEQTADRRNGTMNIEHRPAKLLLRFSQEGQTHCAPLSAYELWKENHNVLSGVSAGDYLKGVCENNNVWGNAGLRAYSQSQFQRHGNLLFQLIKILFRRGNFTLSRLPKIYNVKRRSSPAHARIRHWKSSQWFPLIIKLNSLYVQLARIILKSLSWTLNAPYTWSQTFHQKTLELE